MSSNLFTFLWHLLLPYLTWGNLGRLMLYLPPSTFTFYVVVMHFRRAQDKLTPDLLFLGEKVLLPVGMFHNFLNNVLVMSVVFVDIPREFTTTGRLDRYWQVENPQGRVARVRKRIALAIRHRLDPFDPRGVHS